MTNEDDDVSYLDIKEQDKIPVPMGEQAVWAKIGDNLQLEYINWEMINLFAAQFDELTKAGQEKTDSHVMCKLIALVRDLVKEETMARARLEFSKND
jgi:hypothetical protein